MSTPKQQPLTSVVIDSNGLLVGTTGPLLLPTGPPRSSLITIAEAIDILSLAVHGHAFTIDKRFYDALKLGLEILVKFSRPNTP